MKQIEQADLKLCKLQADIFALSHEALSCSSSIFMRRFMRSGVARRMDTGGFLFEACDAGMILRELEGEYGPTDYGRERFPVEELYWIGYIYRYWCCTSELSSKQVYKIIKPSELRKLYFPYHSLDPAQAIERITEARQIPDEDMTQKGVRLLRNAIRKKEQLKK